MNTLPTASQSSSLRDEKISSADLVYFQDRLRNRLYDLVLSEFEKTKQDSGLTQAILARRLGKRPEQVNRWFSTPGNWTIETISNLLIGINESELVMSVKSINNQKSATINGNVVGSDNAIEYSQFRIDEKTPANISFPQAVMVVTYAKPPIQSKT